MLLKGCQKGALHSSRRTVRTRLEVSVCSLVLKATCDSERVKPGKWSRTATNDTQTFKYVITRENVLLIQAWLTQRHTSIIIFRPHSLSNIHSTNEYQPLHLHNLPSNAGPWGDATYCASPASATIIIIIKSTGDRTPPCGMPRQFCCCCPTVPLSLSIPSVEHGVPVVDVSALFLDLPLPLVLLLADLVQHAAA